MEKTMQQTSFKKIAGLLALMAMAALILFGCAKNQTVTYVGKQNGMDSEITYKAKGDIVQEQISKIKIPYDEIGGKDQAELALSVAKESLKDIKGLKYESKSHDKYAEQIVTIDLTKVDFDQLKKINKDLDIKGKKVSLKKSVEKLEESGFKKK